MAKRNGTEYVQNPGECPFCGSDEIEGGTDNSFESDSMISGGCRCRDCGKTWAESYTLDGWLEECEDGPDKYHQDTRHQKIEEERDRLREQVRILREAMTIIKGLLEEHSEAMIGNSKIHFCMHKASAALEETKEADNG